MALPRLRLALLVAGAAGIAFLNPWLLLLAAGGYAAGWAARRIVRAVRAQRGAAKAGTRVKILGALGLAGVLAAVVVATTQVTFDEGVDGGPGLRATWSAPYRARLVYADGVFRISEQFKLSPRLRAKPGVLAPGGTPADPAWSRVGLRDGQLVIEHRRPPIAANVRTYPLRTSIRIALTSFRLADGDRIVPSESSTVDVTGPRRLIADTDPSTTSTTKLSRDRERRRITLVDSGSFEAVDAIDLQANSVLARNPVVSPLLGLSLWTPVVWVIGILSAILGDWAKDRIKRLLGLARDPAPDAPAGAPV
jgi:hypothetical protein